MSQPVTRVARHQLQHLKCLGTHQGIEVLGARVDCLKLPLLVYRNAFGRDGDSCKQGGTATADSVAQEARTRLKKNGWHAHEWTWASGAGRQPHYHDNTHEVVVVLSGSCSIAWGRAGHIRASAARGDVIFHPAGLYHAGLGNSEDCMTMGMYPAQSPPWEMLYTGPTEKQGRTIERVSTAACTDPIFGAESSFSLAGWYDALEIHRGLSPKYGWEELQDVIVIGRLELLGRDVDTLKEYKAYMTRVRNQYRAIEDYIRIHKFKEVAAVDATGKRYAESKEPSSRVTSTESKTEVSALVWTANDYPYNLEAGITHLILWSKSTSEFTLQVRLDCDMDASKCACV